MTKRAARRKISRLSADYGIKRVGDTTYKVDVYNVVHVIFVLPGEDGAYFRLALLNRYCLDSYVDRHLTDREYPSINTIFDLLYYVDFTALRNDGFLGMEATCKEEVRQ